MLKLKIMYFVRNKDMNNSELAKVEKMKKKAILKVKNECKQLLHGHYPLSSKQYFTEMSQIVSAEERPDQYGQGDSLRTFEDSLVELFGHDDCVFLQSGTMAQLISMRVWTDQKNNSLIAFHPTCHLEIHEQNSYKVLHNLQSELMGQKNRLLNIEDLKNLKSNPASVILELPQREIGGQLPSWEELNEQIEYLHSKDIIVHLDGARLWECAPYYKKSYQEIAMLFDSVYVSFYKGIGAIAGAALLGPSDFIKEARVWNRRHGGNLITASPLYLSAKYNMKKRIHSFESYYKKTLEIHQIILKKKGMRTLPSTPQVNMFHLIIKGNKEDLVSRALSASKKTGIWGFAHIQSTADDSYCKLEWYVGDATLDVPLPKIEEFLDKMAGI
jgi:threonine aldolase